MRSAWLEETIGEESENTHGVLLCFSDCAWGSYSEEDTHLSACGQGHLVTGVRGIKLEVNQD